MSDWLLAGAFPLLSPPLALPLCTASVQFTATIPIGDGVATFDLSPAAAVDLCIPIDPAAPASDRPSCFYLPSPSVAPASAGTWVGSVSAGSSVNCPVRAAQKPCDAKGRGVSFRVTHSTLGTVASCRSCRCVRTRVAHTRSASDTCCHSTSHSQTSTSSYVSARRRQWWTTACGVGGSRCSHDCAWCVRVLVRATQIAVVYLRRRDSGSRTVSGHWRRVPNWKGH